MNARQEAATAWVFWMVHEQKLSRTHLQRITGLSTIDSAALLTEKALSDRQWTRVCAAHESWSADARRHLAGQPEVAAP